MDMTGYKNNYMEATCIHDQGGGGGGGAFPLPFWQDTIAIAQEEMRSDGDQIECPSQGHGVTYGHIGVYSSIRGQMPQQITDNVIPTK